MVNVADRPWEPTDLQGVYFGRYASQWTARNAASPGVAQTEEESQLLLGVNDIDAAEAMRLQATAFNSEFQQSTRQYLTWVKSIVVRGFPVIIGVFFNMDDDSSDVVLGCRAHSLAGLLARCVASVSEQAGTRVAPVNESRLSAQGRHEQTSIEPTCGNFSALACKSSRRIQRARERVDKACPVAEVKASSASRSPKPTRALTERSP